MEKYELVTDIKKVERLIFEINTIHKSHQKRWVTDRCKAASDI